MNSLIFFMSKINTRAKLIFVLHFLWSLNLFANNEQLVTQKMAINFNNQIPKSFVNKPVYLKQYFVPKSWSNLTQDEQVIGAWDFLVQSSSHPQMTRILIHPSDLITSQKIEEALQKYNLPHDFSLFEVPYLLTESRSLYPVSAQQSIIPVSPRLSMTHGFGKWGGVEQDYDSMGYTEKPYNKLISSKQAEFAIFASRLIQEKLSGTSGDYFEIQPDRMVLTIKSPDSFLDLGETFRDITSVTSPTHYGVPSFVQQNIRGSLLMAYANGYNSVFEYLKTSEAEIRGRAIAEFFIRTGFVHSSPHSQNFLLQADKNFRLTGKLFIRDLADLIPSFDSRLADGKMAQLFENFEDARDALHKNLDGGKEYFAFRHSFFKGSFDERFLTYEQQQQIELETAKFFMKTLSHYSGVPFLEIEKIAQYHIKNVNEDYATTLFDRNSPTWKAVLEGIKNFNNRNNHINLSRPEKEIFEGKKKLNDLFTKIIVKSLKSENLNNDEIANLQYLWKTHDQLSLSTSELSKLVNIMVLSHSVPADEIFNVYEGLKDVSVREYLLSSLMLEENRSALMVFLKGIHKKFSKTQPGDLYFEKQPLNSFLTTLISNLEQKKSFNSNISDSIYFALTAVTKPEFKSDVALKFMGLTKSTHTVSSAIWNDLKTWKKKYKSDSWVVDTILAAKPIRTPYSCLINY